MFDAYYWLFKWTARKTKYLYKLVTQIDHVSPQKTTNQTNKTKQKQLDVLPALRHRPLTDPSFPVYPANVMQVYELHEYT